MEPGQYEFCFYFEEVRAEVEELFCLGGIVLGERHWVGGFEGGVLGLGV